MLLLQPFKSGSMRVHLFLVTLLVWIIQDCDALEVDENMYLSVLNWTENHLPDKMRAYGNGFSLTPGEEVALDKFRPLVKDLAAHPFFYRDNCLVKFLRARGLDIHAAMDMFKSAMEWRAKRHIDDLVKKDYGYLEKLVPFVISGVDKQSGPVLYFVAGAHDIRKAILAGHFHTLEELYDRVFEIGVRAGVHIFEATGHNVGLTGTLIIDLAGFNVRQHGCTQCLLIYAHVMTTYERYYPQVLRKIYFINAPRAFEVVLEVIRPIMSPHTASAYQVFGVHKNEWGPALKAQITIDQLLVRYGGTRKVNRLSTQKLQG